jgi:sulfoxide reductase heme-binding subunit YedZ
MVRWVLKPTVFAVSLLPLAWIIWAGLTGNLSANPLSDITNETGVWALRFLCITLAVTPVRRLTGWHLLVRFRRMTGLFAFFYGTLHFLIYVIVDRFAALDFPDGIVAWGTVTNLLASVAADVYKRPFITIGFATLMILLPLAVTSTAGMIRRLGGRRWQTLHRFVYLAGATAVLHYWWLVKVDVTYPYRYAMLVGVLLAVRAAPYLRARFRSAPPTRLAPNTASAASSLARRR